MAYQWREDKRQKTCLWVGLLFCVFYFGEAFLFWGPEPRVAAPPATPLVFWGSFGVALFPRCRVDSSVEALQSPEIISTLICGWGPPGYLVADYGRVRMTRPVYRSIFPEPEMR